MESNLNYVQVVIDKLNAEIDLYPDLTELYALLVLTKGLATTLEDVHDAWSIWQNRTVANHRSLIPFDELTLEIQELDRPYMDAIHAVALDLQTIKQ